MHAAWIGRIKALFAPPPRRHASAGGHPSPAALAAPPARLRRPPERPAARRRAAQRDFGWCWAGVSGWGRGAPQGCPGVKASGRAVWKAGGIDFKRGRCDHLGGRDTLLTNGLRHGRCRCIHEFVHAFLSCISCRARPGQLAWIIRSAPASAATASGRTSPCVSAMIPRKRLL